MSNNKPIISNIIYDDVYTIKINFYITDLENTNIPIERSIEYCNLVDNEMGFYDYIIADYIRDVFNSVVEVDIFKLNTIYDFINKYPKFKIELVGG